MTKTPFSALEKLNGWIAQAEAHLQTLKTATEMPAQNRALSEMKTKEKLETYEFIRDMTKFLLLNQDIMLSFLHEVHAESMVNDGKLSFKLTRQLAALKQTMEDQYQEYQKSYEDTKV